MSSLKILITTFNDQKTAVSVLRTLLEEKLIACGTLLPTAHSLYYWKEKIEEAEEVVVWMKTSSNLLLACQERLVFLHSYEVPEILVIEPSSVNEAYQQWLESSLKRVIPLHP